MRVRVAKIKSDKGKEWLVGKEGAVVSEVDALNVKVSIEHKETTMLVILEKEELEFLDEIPSSEEVTT